MITDWPRKTVSEYITTAGNFPTTAQCLFLWVTDHLTRLAQRVRPPPAVGKNCIAGAPLPPGGFFPLAKLQRATAEPRSSCSARAS